MEPTNPSQWIASPKPLDNFRRKSIMYSLFLFYLLDFARLPRPQRRSGSKCDSCAEDLEFDWQVKPNVCKICKYISLGVFYV